VVNHAITRYRIRAEAYRVAFAGAVATKLKGEWRTRAELKQLPFTAAHRKIADALAAAQA
jgi:hypothetical protein